MTSSFTEEGAKATPVHTHGGFLYFVHQELHVLVDRWIRRPRVNPRLQVEGHLVAAVDSPPQPDAADLNKRGAEVEAIQHARRLGRGFGSVRTSILLAALEQLRSAEKDGLLPPEPAELRNLIERQLARRGAWRPEDDSPTIPAQHYL